MPLSAGQRLGGYEIVAPLGAGGMGEVYRARDTKLHRDVAIKVLSPTLASDPGALARFEREAQSVAQLSHPNILAIHEFGSDAGVTYAVTELLDGQTLRERLAEGPLPLRTAVAYALQIVRGLAAAHDRGIVHRDLKPDNVFILRDDRVKILDFGLARPAALPDQAGATVGAATAVGSVVGTFGYMAPEQVRAQALDHRADIFAFGALLYEMVTGRRAFIGDTPADSISAILHADPPELARSNEVIPPGLERIVRRALEKKPELRFQSAHDLAFALETLPTASGSGSVVVSPPPATTPSRASAIGRVVPWLVAAIGLAFGVWALLARGGVATAPQVVRLDLSLPPGVELHAFGGSVAIAPDGQTVVFVGVRGGTRQLYLRRIGQDDPQPVKGTETAFRAFFSPDNERVGVVLSDGSFRLVTLATGLVTPVNERSDFLGSTWTYDDHIVFTRDQKLWRFRAAGGSAVQVRHPSSELQFSFPVALEDPDKVLVAITSGTNTDIGLLSLSSGEHQVLVSSADFPMYAGTGHLLFLRGGALMGVSFDAVNGRLRGEEVPLFEGMPTSGRAAAIALSTTGTIVYAGEKSLQSDLVWVSRDGLERPLSRVPRQYANPRVSPDGRLVLAQTLTGEFWVHDRARDTMSHVAVPVPLIGFPVWMPNGRELVYKTLPGIHRLDLTTGQHAPIEGGLPNDYPSAISPDGRTLAVTRLNAPTSGDIYLIRLDGREQPRAWLASPGYDGGATWSPDGRWLAYVSLESGQGEIYLQPYPGPGPRRQVSTDGGGHPLWSRDGRELFYRSNSRMYAVTVTPDGEEAVLSQPRLLFDRLYGFGLGITIPNYDITADGREFVVVKDSGATRLNVVLNWTEELRKAVR